MSRLTADLRRRVEWQTRHIALAVIGGALVLMGLGFIISALWLLIAREISPLAASTSLGLLFLGAGLVVFVLRARSPQPRVAPAEAHLRDAARRDRLYRPEGEFPALLEAFLFGVTTYLQMKNRRRARKEPARKNEE